MDRFSAKIGRSPSNRFDVCVLGAGLSGLLAATELQRAGFRTCVVQKGDWWSSQSAVSQGFIHCGLKYFDVAPKTEFKRGLARGRVAWNRFLSRRTQSPIQHTRINYLFTARSSLAQSFQSVAREHHITATETTGSDKVGGFRGRIFETDEFAIDFADLLEMLRSRLAHKLSGPAWNLSRGRGGYVVRSDERQVVHADCVVLAAAQGIPELASRTAIGDFVVKRRPLALATLTGMKQPITAHLFHEGLRPFLTLSSRQNREGDWQWSVGGDVGEGMPHKTQFEDMVAEALTKYFPELSVGRVTSRQLCRIEPADGRNDVSVSGELILQDRVALMLPNKATNIPKMVEAVVTHLSRRSG